MTTNAPEDNQHSAQQWLFSVLWALFHLVHTLRHDPPNEPLTWLTLSAAAWLLTQPRSRAALNSLATIQIITFAIHAPDVYNHALITTVANLAILTHNARSWWRARSERAPAKDEAQWPPLARSLRTLLVVAYSAAALAKLNAGFFNPDGSCALTLTQLALEPIPVAISLPAWLALALPWGIALTELAIPALLLHPRSRVLGVIIGMVFHYLIAISPTVPGLGFTSMIFAFLALFLHPNTSAAILRSPPFASLYASIDSSSAQGCWRRCFWAVLVVFGSYVYGMVTLASNPANWRSVAVIVTVVAVVLVWRAVGEGLRWGVGAAGRAFGIGWSDAPLLMLVLVVAASPYLGLGTAPVFTMYSNLRTEGGISNHFLFPRAPWSTAQDEFVRVIRTGNRSVNRLANVGAQEPYALTLHELRRRMGASPDSLLIYEYRGERYEFQRASDDPRMRSGHWLTDRLVRHRPIDQHGNTCFW